MLQMLRNKKNKGQSTLEYAILVIIVIGALLSINIYIKRGLSGRLKESADEVGDQFDPYNTNATVVEKTTSYTQETFRGGKQNRTLLNDEISTTTINYHIINNERTDWGDKGLPLD